MAASKKEKPSKGPELLAPPPRRKPKGSAKARLIAARLAAVQALYQMDVTGQDADAILREYRDWRIGQLIDDVEYVTANEELFAAIVQGVEQRQGDIDPLLQGALGEHSLMRMEHLLRAIFRAGAYELLTHTDTSVAVIISEYVNLCHAFFDAREPGLVNGALSQLAKTVRLE